MRRIDWNAPLSDEDREWLAQAGIAGTKDRIDQNDAKFAPEDDEEDGPDYESRTVAELKAIGASREPAVSFDGCKTKADVVAALEAWDEDHADDDEDDEE